MTTRKYTEEQLARKRALDVAWGKKNKDLKRAAARRWRAAHPGALAIRSKRVKNRTPSWVDPKEMTAIYKGRLLGWHVDHIVPIKGITPDGYEVSGLNVPCNLQYLSASENSSKGCRMTASDYKIACSLKHRCAALQRSADRMHAEAKRLKHNASSRASKARARAAAG